jgi:hypothetical protein
MVPLQTAKAQSPPHPSPLHLPPPHLFPQPGHLLGPRFRLGCRWVAIGNFGGRTVCRSDLSRVKSIRACHPAPRLRAVRSGLTICHWQIVRAALAPRQARSRPPSQARPDFPPPAPAECPLPTRLAHSGNGPADRPPEGPLIGPGEDYGQEPAHGERIASDSFRSESADAARLTNSDFCATGSRIFLWSSVGERKVSYPSILS